MTDNNTAVVEISRGVGTVLISVEPVPLAGTNNPGPRYVGGHGHHLDYARNLITACTAAANAEVESLGLGPLTLDSVELWASVFDTSLDHPALLAMAQTAITDHWPDMPPASATLIAQHTSGDPVIALDLHFSFATAGSTPTPPAPTCQQFIRQLTVAFGAANDGDNFVYMDRTTYEHDRFVMQWLVATEQISFQVSDWRDQLSDDQRAMLAERGWIPDDAAWMLIRSHPVTPREAALIVASALRDVLRWPSPAHVPCQGTNLHNARPIALPATAQECAHAAAIAAQRAEADDTPWVEHQIAEQFPTAKLLARFLMAPYFEDGRRTLDNTPHPGAWSYDCIFQVPAGPNVSEHIMIITHGDGAPRSARHERRTVWAPPGSELYVRAVLLALRGEARAHVADRLATGRADALRTYWTVNTGKSVVGFQPITLDWEKLDVGSLHLERPMP